MTAAVYRSSTPSLSVPPTQNTAPVLEFNCLYTRDVRRKQKRWQDGFLRFHTFNKRIMVYDVPRNFIGDAHWKESAALQDGDEVTLEKTGVIVQVAERVGVTETDLTELRAITGKAGSHHGSSSPIRPSSGATSMPRGRNITSTTQSKHRSLNAMLGTSRRPIGRPILPVVSPFDERRAAAVAYVEDDRPMKRPRLESPAPWTLSRTTLPGKSSGLRPLPLAPRSANVHKKDKRQPPPLPGRQRLGSKEFIDLSEDASGPPRFLPGFSSDALEPPSSPEKAQSTGGTARWRAASPARLQQTMEPAESPLFDLVESSEPGDGRHRRPEGLPTTIDAPGIHQSRTLPSNAAEICARSDHEQSRAPKLDDEPIFQPPLATSSKPSRRLKLAASAPRKKGLLCQEQGSKKKTPSNSHDTAEHSTSDSPDLVLQNPARSGKRAKSPSRQLQERLARISAKERQAHARKQRDDLRAQDAANEAGDDISDHDYDQTHDSEDGIPLSVAKFEQTMLPSLSPPPQESPRPLPPTEPRSLRRVVSESNKPPSAPPKRALGAPVRITPSPSKNARQPAAPPNNSNIASAVDLPQKEPFRKGKKKPLQRSASLTIASRGTSTVILSKPFQTPGAPVKAKKGPAPPPKEPEPWSREAGDLFEWRPPGWDEEKWAVVAEGGGR